MNPLRSHSFCFSSVLAAVLLVGCSAPPVSPQAPRPAAASPGTDSASLQKAATPSKAAAPARPAAKLAANPFEARDPDLIPALAVNSRCAQAASRGALVYAAGNCDNTGQAEGLAAVAAHHGTLLIEGVFDGGRFVAGAKYRTLLRFKGGDEPFVINCTDMRPTSYGPPTGIEAPEFTSTSNTVCKETRANRKGIYLMRKVQPLSEGAIKIGRMFNLMGDVQQQSVATDRVFGGLGSATVHRIEVQGQAGPTTYSRWESPPEYYAKAGATIRRIFAKDAYLDVTTGTRQRMFCLEGAGPDACVRYDPCTAERFLGDSTLYAASHQCVAGPVRPIALSDGSVFTPAASHGVAVYVLGSRMYRPGEARAYPLGDGFMVVPLEGHMRWPDGRQYSGRFVKGEPL